MAGRDARYRKADRIRTVQTSIRLLRCSNLFQHFNRPAFPFTSDDDATAEIKRPLLLILWLRQVIDKMVPVERIELPTFGLQNRCSTAELNRRN
jgi:hypothetical protein